MTERIARRRYPALTGAAILAAFYCVEGQLRQSNAARSFSTGADDRGTTKQLAGSLIVALAGGSPCYFVQKWRIAAPIGWIGVALEGSGFCLRVWAARTLGRYYTRTLRTETEQVLVVAGPYKLVRHPGYAGVLAMWIGYGLSLTSTPALLWTSVPNLLAFRRRIQAEEAMLLVTLGDSYREYQQSTPALVPDFLRQLIPGRSRGTAVAVGTHLQPDDFGPR